MQLLGELRQNGYSTGAVADCLDPAVNTEP